ncbi:DUF4395 domain-containing protein [Thalassobacillus sp. C254]|uniref:DUF4395 domain-containing protein n=1 Tax=Thalassobacillus sp. C254 TaxID=1225341 RepID=UPI0006D2647E|nr:DUF4395 domain-containing protein [Thalassobacillus sp. C254]
MGIPKPLVQANQAFIVSTVLLSLIFSIWILFLPFINGMVSLITNSNPVIRLGRNFLKKKPSQYVLEDPEQQRFNQWISTVCLGLSLLFYFLGFPAISIAFSVMVLLAAGIALTGYCIGCTIRYRYMMWKYKRQQT